MQRYNIDPDRSYIPPHRNKAKQNAIELDNNIINRMVRILKGWYILVFHFSIKFSLYFRLYLFS